MLIEDLIDKTLGYPRQQYIKERILVTLGLEHTFGSISEVNIDEVMSGYYVGVETDFKYENTGLMLATAEDVAIFLRALNDGSVFDKGEQEIYSSIYVYEHTGLLPGYQSIAKYYKDMDMVVIQFNTVTDTYNNPVKNAKVAIYSLPDSVLIAGTTANEKGEFTFPNYYSVNKLMKISYNGYKTTMFRALPEQNVKLREELTMPDNLALNSPSNLPLEKKKSL